MTNTLFSFITVKSIPCSQVSLTGYQIAN